MRKEGSFSLYYFLQEYPLLEYASLRTFLFANTSQLIPCIAPGLNNSTHDFQQIRKFLKRFTLLVFCQFFTQLRIQRLDVGIIGQDFNRASFS